MNATLRSGGGTLAAFAASQGDQRRGMEGRGETFAAAPFAPVGEETGSYNGLSSAAAWPAQTQQQHMSSPNPLLKASTSARPYGYAARHGSAGAAAAREGSSSPVGGSQWPRPAPAPSGPSANSNSAPRSRVEAERSYGNTQTPWAAVGVQYHHPSAASIGAEQKRRGAEGHDDKDAHRRRDGAPLRASAAHAAKFGDDSGDEFGGGDEGGNAELRGEIQRLRAELAETAQQLRTRRDSRSRSRSPSATPATGRARTPPNNRSGNNTKRVTIAITKSSSGAAAKTTAHPLNGGGNNNDNSDLAAVVEALYRRIGDMEAHYDRDLTHLRSLEKSHALLLRENALLVEKDKEQQRLIREMERRETARLRKRALDRIYTAEKGDRHHRTASPSAGKGGKGKAKSGGNAAHSDDEDLGIDDDDGPAAAMRPHSFASQQIAMKVGLARAQEAELRVLRRRVANVESENATLRRKCGLPVGEYHLTRGKPMAANGGDYPSSVIINSHSRSQSPAPTGAAVMGADGLVLSSVAMNGSDIADPNNAVFNPKKSLLFDAISANLGVQSAEGARLSAFLEAERNAMRKALADAQAALAASEAKRAAVERAAAEGPQAPRTSEHAAAVAQSLLGGCQRLLAVLSAAEARAREMDFIAKQQHRDADSQRISSTSNKGGAAAAAFFSSAETNQKQQQMDEAVGDHTAVFTPHHSCANLFAAITHHRAAAEELAASVGTIMARPAPPGAAMVSAAGATAADGAPMDALLTFEVERLRALKAFVPAYAQLAAQIEGMRRDADADEKAVVWRK